MIVRKLLLSAIAALGLASDLATADHCPTLVPVVKYVKVICIEERQVPYTCVICKYDACGRPYHVTVTKYKTIEVEVEKIVKKIVYVPAY